MTIGVNPALIGLAIADPPRERRRRRGDHHAMTEDPNDDDPNRNKLLRDMNALVRDRSFREQKVKIIESLRMVHADDQMRLIGEAMLEVGIALPDDIRKFFGV